MEWTVITATSPSPAASRSGVTTAGPREGEGDVAAPDKLSESALNEAALPIQIFGMELVSLLM